MLKRIFEIVAVNLFIAFLVLLCVFVWCVNFQANESLKSRNDFERVVRFGPPSELSNRTLNVLRLEVLPHDFQNMFDVVAEGGYRFTIYCGEPIQKNAWRKVADVIRDAQSVKVVLISPMSSVMNNILWDGELLITKHGKQFKLTNWVAENDLLFAKRPVEALPPSCKCCISAGGRRETCKGQCLQAPPPPPKPCKCCKGCKCLRPAQFNGCGCEGKKETCCKECKCNK